MMMLSEVATKTIATSSGVLIRPTACRIEAHPKASANEIAKPASEVVRSAPRSRSTWISRPARNSRQARPTVENTSTGSVDDAIPIPCGPTMIPPTSSSTIAGTMITGARPRISGARNAITATMMKLV